MSEGVLRWGIDVILTLQASGSWLVAPMTVVTLLGQPLVYLLVLPAIYWCWDRELGLRLGVALLLSLGVNEILKVAFHGPRPYWYDARVHLLTSAESSFGMPSGHAQHSMVAWGTIARYVRTWWGWVLAIALSLLIGFSRVYLGVHFPTDVVVGWLIGVLLLVLLMQVEKPLLGWLATRTTIHKAIWIFLASLGLVGLGLIVKGFALHAAQLPAVWMQNVAYISPTLLHNAFSIRNVIEGAGALFGLGFGHVWLAARGGFELGGPFRRRAGRYLTGLLGLIVIWAGLKLIFQVVALDDTALGYGLLYIRYALVGAWITAMAPILFMRLKLILPESD